MSISFSLNSKPQSNRTKRPSVSAGTDSPTRNYVTEFHPAEAPPSPGSKTQTIAPLPNKELRHNKKLKNLTTLPEETQSNGDDTSARFERDPGSNSEPADGSNSGYGLNLRKPSDDVSGGVPNGKRSETLADFELRKLREDLENLPEGPGIDEFKEVPVEVFGAAFLSGYGWKEGRGIGRNTKEDVKVSEVKRKIGRGGLGFTDELPGNNRVDSTADAAENNGGQKKVDVRKEKETFRLGKEVRIVYGRDIGMKGKITEVKSGGDLLVLRISKSNEKVKVRSTDVAELGSADEVKCLRNLKELKLNSRDLDKDRKDRNLSSKRGVEEERGSRERVNWLRSHIKVKIISEELKGGKLFLKKGVVVDVVGPGMCDISIDESRELIQGVHQDLLETALPKRGGPVIVLYGRHKGVYGSLLERDSEKETGVVRNEDTHELLNVKLDQIAEFNGDPSDIGY